MTMTDLLQNQIQKEISELTDSINLIVDNFKTLRNPLAESHEKVPIAARQLDKVTEQTEAAANRMLDMLETITERQGEVITGLETIKGEVEKQGAEELTTLANSLVEKVNTNLNDAYSIMDALQFQDITSQQVNHAVSLLEDLGGKLQTIVTAFHGNPPEETAEEMPRKERAFDPRADMNDKKTNQADIDNLFNNRA